MAELLSVDDPVKRATQNAIEERRNPSHVAARSAEQYDKMIADAGLEIVDTASVSITRNLREWLDAYRTPDAVAATVIEMVEAGLETDAAGIGARRRGDRIEFQQRMYYLKAVETGRGSEPCSPSGQRTNQSCPNNRISSAKSTSSRRFWKPCSPANERPLPRWPTRCAPATSVSC